MQIFDPSDFWAFDVLTSPDVCTGQTPTLRAMARWAPARWAPTAVPTLTCFVLCPGRGEALPPFVRAMRQVRPDVLRGRGDVPAR